MAQLKDIKSARRILFVHQFLAMGDAILLSPVYKTIKDNVPGINLSVLTNEYSIPFVKSIPYVDEVHSMEALFRNSNSRILRLLRLSGFLLGKRFDTLVLRGDKRFSQRAFTLVPSICRIKTIKIGEYLDSEVNADRHIVESYYKILEKIGLQVKEKKHLYVKISNESVREAEKLLSKDHKKGYIGIAPVSNVPVKNWSADNVSELINKLDKEDYGIILFCADEDFYSKVKNLIDNKNIIHVDKMDFSLLMAVVSLCHKFIGVDTGLTHLAAAVGVPVLGLYGPTSGTLAGPYSELADYIQSDIDCPWYNPLSLFSPNEKLQECYSDGHCKLPLVNCVEKIGVESVLKALHCLPEK